MNVIGKALLPPLAAALLVAGLAGVGLTPCAAESGPPRLHQPMAQKTVARVGEPAPDFTLDAVLGKEFRRVGLAEYRGKWVILFFYPLDFTFVCPTEIRGFNEAFDLFKEKNTVIVGASVDSKWSHKAWIERGDLGELKYPLLSDLKKETARDYGVLDEREGVAMRGLFIIDDKGVLQYLSVNNLSVGRSIEETMRVLDALQTGELCPLGWKPGQKTLGK